MIILDTNVLSEALNPAPSTKVLHWIGERPVEELFTTAIGDLEGCGVRVMDPWKEP